MGRRNQWGTRLKFFERKVELTKGTIRADQRQVEAAEGEFRLCVCVCVWEAGKGSNRSGNSLIVDNMAHPHVQVKYLANCYETLSKIAILQEITSFKQQKTGNHKIHKYLPQPQHRASRDIPPSTSPRNPSYTHSGRFCQDRRVPQDPLLDYKRLNQLYLETG